MLLNTQWVEDGDTRITVIFSKSVKGKQKNREKCDGKMAAS